MRQHWPEIPVQVAAPWWTAQLYQESRFRPEAVSSAGAAGLAQFMPATWSEVVGRLGWDPGLSPHLAEPAILAGAWYQARLRHTWRGRGRPWVEAHRLGLVSYNAGTGNILAAQRRCADARDWQDIAPCLPQVTGRHAAETQGYVPAIERWRAIIIAGGRLP